jgi:hypothetical protein
MCRRFNKEGGRQPKAADQLVSNKNPETSRYFQECVAKFKDSILRESAWTMALSIIFSHLVQFAHPLLILWAEQSVGFLVNLVSQPDYQ